MHIPIETAARLAGVKPRAVYKMIKKETIPCLKATALGRTSYRIPLDKFCQWIGKEILRAEEKINHLKRAKAMIEEKLRNV